MDSIIIFGARHLTAIMILIALAFFLRLSREKQKEMFVFGVITLPVIYIAAKIASFVYFNPRPFVVGNFVPLIAHAPDNGFPSEHTLLSAAVASIVYFFNKKLGMFLFFLALLVGASRVLAGVHHSLDVTGSIVIVILASWAVYKWVLPMVLKSKLFKKGNESL